MARKKTKPRPAALAAATDRAPAHFRFFDNREKYLMFVTTCSEKEVIAERVGMELRHVGPGDLALRLFDAGVGDGTVLSKVMRDLHRRFTHVPWLVVGKEISMEDMRLCLSKMADRFYEHPELVIVMTNMYYSEAPRLAPKSAASAAALKWHEVALEGDSAHEFDRQIRALQPILAADWQVTNSQSTGNPLYVRPAVLVLYRKDREFVLQRLLPRPGAVEGEYDLILCSQPYRARNSAGFKVRQVIAPLARALAPGGRLFTVQSYGGDPGMQIVNRIWPGEQPFRTRRHELLQEARQVLDLPQDRGFRFIPYSDARALFRYHLHTLPSEVGGSIGTSTLLAAWNAAVYVAQIEDDTLQAALAEGKYLNATRDVLREHGGLWFMDESFVIARMRR